MNIQPNAQIFRQMLINNDFLAAVDLGIIDGVNSDSKFGHCPDAANVVTDVWELGLTIPEYIYPDKTGESIVIDQVVAGDEGVLVTIEGLDVFGFFQAQTVAASSAVDVAVPGSWRAVNRAYNANGVKFVGLVTISNVGGTKIFAAISPDDQQTSQAIYHGAVDEVLLIRNFSNAVNRTGGPTLDSIKRLAIELPDGVFRTQIRYGLQREGVSNISSDLIVGIPLPPLTKIKISAEPSNADTDVSAEWSMHKYKVDWLGLDYVNRIQRRWALPDLQALPEAA